MQMTVYLLISVAVVVVIVAAIIGYQVISTENTPTVANPAKDTIANAINSNAKNASNNQKSDQLIENKQLNGSVASSSSSSNSTTPDLTPLARYAATVQPLLADLTTVMNKTVTDLKEFLQRVNNTTDKAGIRRTINEFREQLKLYDQQLDTVHNNLQMALVPPVVQPSHNAITTGVKKYQQAVQGYIQGLTEYNFARIKASQATLETADKEIRQAATEFQKQIKALS
jgi:uncharacterized protein (UPF0333 family)